MHTLVFFAPQSLVLINVIKNSIFVLDIFKKNIIKTKKIRYFSSCLMGFFPVCIYYYFVVVHYCNVKLSAKIRKTICSINLSDYIKIIANSIVRFFLNKLQEGFYKLIRRYKYHNKEGEVV